MTATMYSPARTFEQRLHRSHLGAAVFIAVLNGLDILTTALCLRYGAVEGNPIARFFLETGLLWPLKVGVPLLVVCLVVFQEQIDRWWGEHVGKWWKKHRPRWLPHLPEPTPLFANNLAWLVAGVYCLVIVLNTWTLIATVV